MEIWLPLNLLTLQSHDNKAPFQHHLMAPSDILLNFFLSLLDLLLDTGPWLIIGFLVAGLVPLSDKFGDTLFSGGVGRPEPGPGATEVWLAGKLYESLFRRLLSLPDPVEVFPAQGAAHRPGTEPEPCVVTTIGLERRLNPALQCASPDEFARLVRGHGIV